MKAQTELTFTPPALLYPTRHSAVETKSHKGHIILDITGQTYEMCEPCLIHAPNVGGERRKVSGCQRGACRLAATQQKLFFLNAICRTPLLAPFF